jgi:hypothetical protein
MEGHGGHGGGDMDDMCNMNVRISSSSYFLNFFAPVIPLQFNELKLFK